MKTETKILNGYLLTVTHKHIEGMSKNMHSYSIILSDEIITSIIHYENSNVIDRDKFISIEMAENRVKNWFKYMNNKLNN